MAAPGRRGGDPARLLHLGHRERAARQPREAVVAVGVGDGRGDDGVRRIEQPDGPARKRRLAAVAHAVAVQVVELGPAHAARGRARVGVAGLGREVAAELRALGGAEHADAGEVDAAAVGRRAEAGDVALVLPQALVERLVPGAAERIHAERAGVVLRLADAVEAAVGGHVHRAAEVRGGPSEEGRPQPRSVVREVQEHRVVEAARHRLVEAPGTVLQREVRGRGHAGHVEAALRVEVECLARVPGEALVAAAAVVGAPLELVRRAEAGDEEVADAAQRRLEVRGPSRVQERQVVRVREPVNEQPPRAVHHGLVERVVPRAAEVRGPGHRSGQGEAADVAVLQAPAGALEVGAAGVQGREVRGFRLAREVDAAAGLGDAVAVVPVRPAADERGPGQRAVRAELADERVVARHVSVEDRLEVRAAARVHERHVRRGAGAGRVDAPSRVHHDALVDIVVHPAVERGPGERAGGREAQHDAVDGAAQRGLVVRAAEVHHGEVRRRRLADHHEVAVRGDVAVREHVPVRAADVGGPQQRAGRVELPDEGVGAAVDRALEEGRRAGIDGHVGRGRVAHDVEVAGQRVGDALVGTVEAVAAVEREPGERRVDDQRLRAVVRVELDAHDAALEPEARADRPRRAALPARERALAHLAERGAQQQRAAVVAHPHGLGAFVAQAQPRRVGARGDHEVVVDAAVGLGAHHPVDARVDLGEDHARVARDVAHALRAVREVVVRDPVARDPLLGAGALGPHLGALEHQLEPRPVHDARVALRHHARRAGVAGLLARARAQEDVAQPVAGDEHAPSRRVGREQQVGVRGARGARHLPQVRRPAARDAVGPGHSIGNRGRARARRRCEVESAEGEQGAEGGHGAAHGASTGGGTAAGARKHTGGGAGKGRRILMRSRARGVSPTKDGRWARRARPTRDGRGAPSLRARRAATSIHLIERPRPTPPVRHGRHLRYRTLVVPRPDGRGVAAPHFRPGGSRFCRCVLLRR